MLDDEEDEGPVFDTSGKVVRIHRKRKQYSLAGFYFFVIPAMFVTFAIISWLISNPDPRNLLYFIFPAILWGGAGYLYLAMGERPEGSIDLTKDSIRQFEGKELDTEIMFSSTVDVDIILNRYTKDPRFGHLWGYRFSKDKDVIEFSAGDDWQLWDVQNLRGPVFEVVDIHRMQQGKDLREYREVLAGGLPPAQPAGPVVVPPTI